MSYDAILFVSMSLAVLCAVGLLISCLSDRRNARKRRQAVLPDYDVYNPINAARLARPGVGEVDENGFTKLW